MLCGRLCISRLKTWQWRNVGSWMTTMLVISQGIRDNFCHRPNPACVDPLQNVYFKYAIIVYRLKKKTKSD